jgi:hypothetical protein
MPSSTFGGGTGVGVCVGVGVAVGIKEVEVAVGGNTTVITEEGMAAAYDDPRKNKPDTSRMIAKIKPNIAPPATHKYLRLCLIARFENIPLT